MTETDGWGVVLEASALVVDPFIHTLLFPVWIGLFMEGARRLGYLDTLAFFPKTKSWVVRSVFLRRFLLFFLLFLPLRFFLLFFVL